MAEVQKCEQCGKEVRMVQLGKDANGVEAWLFYCLTGHRQVGWWPTWQEKAA